MPKPCSGGDLAAFFHLHNEWTGMCGCGAGPFVKADWREHYLVVTARVGETVHDLDAPQPPTSELTPDAQTRETERKSA